jgi:hypothetical protein
VTADTDFVTMLALVAADVGGSTPSAPRWSEAVSACLGVGREGRQTTKRYRGRRWSPQRSHWRTRRASRIAA